MYRNFRSPNASNSGGNKVCYVSEREILDMLAITDGIPRYLEELNPSLSCKDKENLRRMCFVANAPLRVNFDDIFMDVITKQPRLSAKVIRHSHHGTLVWEYRHPVPRPSTLDPKCSLGGGKRIFRFHRSRAAPLWNGPTLSPTDESDCHAPRPD